MEALALGGVPTALFLQPPRPEQLTGRFAALGALGVAGVGRSLSPGEMDHELPAVFEALGRLGAPLVHYKVCSTFDSSPTMGSIGHAIDIGLELLDPPFVPVAVGVPILKRFVVFGNHFATVGDETFRLDRHPSMSRHPGDAHARRRPPAAPGLPDEEGDRPHRRATPGRAPGSHRCATGAAFWPMGGEIVLFDTVDDAHLLTVGQTLWAHRGDRPLLVVGSSGVEYALVACWQALGVIRPPSPFTSPGPVDQLLVDVRERHPRDGRPDRMGPGQRLPVHAPRCSGPHRPCHQRRGSGTSRGRCPGTARLRSEPCSLSRQKARTTRPSERRRRVRRQRVWTPGALDGNWRWQRGRFCVSCWRRVALRRVCTVGGDTSSHVTRQLGIYALELLMPLAPAAPLCRASADDPRFDGLEIAMKGGQIGAPDYFRAVQRGQL